MIEGRLRQVSRDWPKAIETYRALWQFFPDNPEYALRLASSQTSAGQGRDALQTIATLRQSSSASGEDARFDLANPRLTTHSAALDPLWQRHKEPYRVGKVRARAWLWRRPRSTRVGPGSVWVSLRNPATLFRRPMIFFQRQVTGVVRQ